MTKIRVTEDLHHGDYHNVRTEVIEDTYPAFVEFVKGSPYLAQSSVKESNIFLHAAYAAMHDTGKCGFGWAWYISEPVPVLKNLPPSISLAVSFDHSTGEDVLHVVYTDHGDNSTWVADVAEDSEEGTALLDAIDGVWKLSDDPNG